MIAILGPPPFEFRNEARSVLYFGTTMVCRQLHYYSSVFFLLQCLIYLLIRFKFPGRWKDLEPIPDITLESLAVDIQGEDKEGFLQFLRKALKWIPEDRPTARELLFDAWLMKGLDLQNRMQSSG